MSTFLGGKIMRNNNFIKAVIVSGLFIISLLAINPASMVAAPVAEAESNLTSQINWGWYYNQTAAQINAAKKDGSRPIALIPNGEIETEPRYHVLYVKNAGDYKVDDWQVVIRDLDNAAKLPTPAFRSSGWRVTNVAVHEVKDTINGKPVTAKRAATIIVKDSIYNDYDVRVWLTYEQLIALGNQYRVVDVDNFETNGSTYYSAVIVPNKGANYKHWAWLFNSTKGDILTKAKKIDGKAFRVTDMERRSNGKYDVLMVETKGEAENWYSNLTDETMKEDYGGPFNGGVRFFDLVSYKEGNTTKFEVLTLENGSGKYLVSHSNAPGFEDFDAAFMKVMSRYGIPGGSFALAKNGKVIYKAGYGMADLKSGFPANPSTRGRIASISKTITTAALMKLWEEGKIDLENKVFAPGGYLSSIKPFDYSGYKGNAVPNLEKITLRNLLNHTGGWDRQKSGDPNAAAGTLCDGGMECEPTMYILPRILAHAKKQKTIDDSATQLASIDDIIRYMIKPDDKDYLPVYAPGTKFAYSNFGFTCIQKIVELRSGKPYDQYIKEMGDKMGVQFLKGNSKPENKGQFEWTYHPDPGAEETPWAAWSSAKLSDPVPQPYTRDMKMLLGHGGWVVSPDDLVNFVSKLDGTAANPWIKKSTFLMMMQRPSYITDKTAPYYGLCWRVEPLGTDTDDLFRYSHGGALDGSSSLLVKAYHDRKVTISFLFNAREDSADSAIRKAIEPLIAEMDDKGILAGLAK
jgi:CubicO group peptidase (beta-lactamase class C family)